MSQEREIDIAAGGEGVVITVANIEVQQSTYEDLTQAKLKIGAGFLGNGCLGLTSVVGSLGLIAVGGANIIAGLKSASGENLLFGVGAFSVGGVSLLSAKSFFGKATENYQILDQIEKRAN